MEVPLSVGDFLERAELVYGERTAVVDLLCAGTVARARSDDRSA